MFSLQCPPTSKATNILFRCRGILFRLLIPPLINKLVSASCVLFTLLTIYLPAKNNFTKCLGDFRCREQRKLGEHKLVFCACIRNWRRTLVGLPPRHSPRREYLSSHLRSCALPPHLLLLHDVSSKLPLSNYITLMPFFAKLLVDL